MAFRCPIQVAETQALELIEQNWNWKQRQDSNQVLLWKSLNSDLTIVPNAHFFNIKTKYFLDVYMYNLYKTLHILWLQLDEL